MHLMNLSSSCFNFACNYIYPTTKSLVKITIMLKGLQAFVLRTGIYNVSGLMKCPLPEDQKNHVLEAAKRLNIVSTLCFNQWSEEYTGKSEGAIGCNYKWSHPQIFLNKELKEFALYHELGHIQKSHTLKAGLLEFALTTGACFIQVPTYIWIAGVIVGLAELFILKRSQEKEADLIACQYIDSVAIAEAIHDFSAERLLNKLKYDLAEKQSLINRVKTYLSVTSQGNLLMSPDSFPLYFDTHPFHTERISYLMEIYFQKLVDPSLKIEIENDQNQMILKDSFTKKEWETIINAIRNSPKGEILFDTQRISLYPSKKEGNIKFHLSNPQTDQSYTLDAKKLENYISIHDPKKSFPIILEIIQEVLLQPDSGCDSFNLSFEPSNKNATNEENINSIKTMVRETLSNKYDFDHMKVEPLEEKNGYKIILPKKTTTKVNN